MDKVGGAMAEPRTGGRRKARPVMSGKALSTAGPDRAPTRSDRRAAARQPAPPTRPGRDRPTAAETRRSRLVVGLALAAVVALAAGLALVTGLFSPPAGPARAVPAATAHTLVRSPAAGIAFDGSDGWLADDATGTLRRFDPSSGSYRSGPVTVGGHPVAVAAGAGEAWATDVSGNTVVEVSARSGRVVGSPVTVGTDPVSVAVGEGGVWVASLQAGTVTLIDPRSGQVTATVALPDGAVRVAVGAGAVWVTGQSDSLTRIDPVPAGVSLRWTSVTVGQGPIGVAVSGSTVWVANTQSGTVSRVDSTTMKVTGTFPVPSATGSGTTGGPTSIAVADGRVWVADYGDARVVALDSSTGRQVGTAVVLPGAVRQLVTGAGAIWAATANPGAVVRLDPS